MCAREREISRQHTSLVSASIHVPALLMHKIFKLGIPLRKETTAGTKSSFNLIQCTLKSQTLSKIGAPMELSRRVFHEKFLV